MHGAEGVATENVGTLSGTRNDGGHGADGVDTEYVGTPSGTGFSTGNADCSPLSAAAELEALVTSLSHLPDLIP